MDYPLFVPNDIIINRKIGQGTYGEVYSGYDQKSSRLVALKYIKFSNKDNGIPSSALREISILKKLKHPNIVKLKEIYYQ